MVKARFAIDLLSTKKLVSFHSVQRYQILAVYLTSFIGK